MGIVIQSEHLDALQRPCSEPLVLLCDFDHRRSADHVHMGMSAGRVVPAIFSQSTAEAEARFAEAI